MSRAQMEQNAQAALDEQSKQREAEAVAQAELIEREATRNSAEVQALNDIAQAEIFGDRATPGQKRNEQGRAGGLLEEIANNRRYGTTEAERAEAVSEYTDALQELLEDDFELTQAKLILDLKLEDNEKRSAFIAKQIGAGKSAVDAEVKAYKVYDTKDEKRRALVKENQLFTREAYDNFFEDSKAKDQAQEESSKAEKIAAEQAAEQARRDTAEALEETTPAEPDEPAIEVEADEPAAEVEADEPAAEVEADEPAIEADPDKAPFVDALNEALVEGEDKGEELVRLRDKAKQLIAEGNDPQEVIDSFIQASEAQIDAVMESFVKKFEEVNGSRPSDASLARKRQKVLDGIVGNITEGVDLDEPTPAEVEEPAAETTDEPEVEDEPEETTDEPENEDGPEVEDEPEETTDEPENEDGPEVEDEPEETTDEPENEDDELTQTDSGIKTPADYAAEQAARKKSREEEVADKILQMPGNGELVPRAGILPDFGRRRRARKLLNRRAADLDTGTGEEMYVTKSGRISDIPATVDFDSLTFRQRRAIKQDPKTRKPVTTVDVITDKSPQLVSPAEPSRLYDVVRNTLGKKFDPEDIEAVEALPENYQAALKRFKERLNATAPGTRDRENEQLAFDSLVDEIATQFGKRSLRK